MKNTSSLLALMAALSLGSALAATPPTPAGTAIGNQASASFSDAGGTAQTPVYSNAVVTTVTAVPSFSLIPTSTGTPGTNGAGLTPGVTQNAVPGATVSFPYTLTNTGNVKQDNYDLKTQGSYSATSGAAPQNVTYYKTDTNGNCTTTAVTSVGPLDPGDSAKFCVSYTVPSTAANGDKLGTQPVVELVPHAITSGSYTAPDGTVVAGQTVTEPTLPASNNNYNQTIVTRSNSGVVGPNLDANANGFVDSADTTTLVTPYASPDSTPVTINYGSANKDSQNAQATASTTVVTFKNTVANTGNYADVFDLSASMAGFPTGSQVSITDTSGNVITQTPSLQPGLANGYTFYVKVTVPAGAAPATSGVAPTVTVTSTSQNSLGTGSSGTQSDTTTDILNLPGVLFTDSVNGTPTPSAPNNTVTTTGANSGTVTTTYPMVVKNTGSTPDTFTLGGNVTVNTPTGPVTVPVKYLPDPSCSGSSSSPAITTTPSVAAGGTYCVVASVGVPQNALPGTYTLTDQTATGANGETSSDTNDQFTVQTTTNSYKPVKTVDKSAAAPGDTLTYTITGSNTNNANITKYILKDTVPTNTTFQSVSATITDANNYGTSGYKVLYSTDSGATWSQTAPTSTSTTSVWVGIDTNNDGTITSLDVLKPGQGISETFKVTVN